MLESAVTVSSCGARVAATGAAGCGRTVGTLEGLNSGRQNSSSAAHDSAETSTRPRSANERVRQIHKSPIGGKSKHSAIFSAVRRLPSPPGLLRLGE